MIALKCTCGHCETCTARERMRKNRGIVADPGVRIVRKPCPCGICSKCIRRFRKQRLHVLSEAL